jgi:hypothetical protein
MRLLILAMVLGIAACAVSGENSIGGDSPERATEDAIKGDLADQIGLGVLTASCSESGSGDIGSTFPCSSETEDGRTIEWQAVIEATGCYVETTNVVLVDNLAPIAATIITQIESQVGIDLADDALDCGTESLIVDAANQVVCQLTHPGGDVFDTVVTFNGLDTDNKTFDFFVDTES